MSLRNEGPWSLPRASTPWQAAQFAANSSSPDVTWPVPAITGVGGSVVPPDEQPASITLIRTRAEARVRIPPHST